VKVAYEWGQEGDHGYRLRVNWQEYLVRVCSIVSNPGDGKDDV
jgi:hypothetical protein